MAGFGVIAQGHLSGYAGCTDLDLIAVADICAARRHAAAELGFRTYSTSAEMLESESLDVLDICTPPDAHLPLIREGLERDLAVLCEKPFLQLHEFEMLRPSIENSSGFVYPSHNYRFSPAAQMLQRLVQGDQLGEIRRGTAETVRTGHARGTSDWRPDWRRDPAHSFGGILQDHGPHSIYMTSGLLGKDPVQVSCRLGVLDEAAPWSTEDTAHVTLEFPDDVKFVLHISWTGSVRSTHYALHGTRGSVEVLNDSVIQYGDGRCSAWTLPSDFDDPTHASWFVRVFEDFHAARDTPELRTLPMHEAQVVAATINAAYESARRRGEWVSVSAPALLPRVGR